MGVEHMECLESRNLPLAELTEPGVGVIAYTACLNALATREDGPCRTRFRKMQALAEF